MSDTPKCWTSKRVTARKAHKCCECRGTIQPKEQYDLFSGIWDRAETFRTCLECDALRSVVDAGQPYDEATPFGQLYETVFGRREPEEINRYIETKRKRGASIENWMLEMQAERTALQPKEPHE